MLVTVAWRSLIECVCTIMSVRIVVIHVLFFFFLRIRRPPRSTQSRSSAASDVYKRQVVKDELKTIAKDISTADVLDVFKELFTGYIVEQKKDGIQLVDTKKFDVLEKDSWIKKPDKEPEIPQVFKDRIEAQEKELSDLRMERFTKDITAKVGDKLAKDFMPLYGKLSKEETDKILDVFAFMKDIINELGKAQLVNGNRYAAKAADLEAKIEKLSLIHISEPTRPY